MNSIILVGIKHCGKSTQARLLSKKLNCQMFDTDDIIYELTKKTPRQIYTENGQEGFIEQEIKACQYLKNNLNEKQAIIATGGGICNNIEAIKILKSLGILIFLNIDEETACDRIIDEIIIDKDGIKNLPAYIAKENPQTLDDVKIIFHKFYIARQKLYTQIADISIASTNKSKTANCKMILKQIEESQLLR